MTNFRSNCRFLVESSNIWYILESKVQEYFWILAQKFKLDDLQDFVKIQFLDKNWNFDTLWMAFLLFYWHLEFDIQGGKKVMFRVPVEFKIHISQKLDCLNPISPIKSFESVPSRMWSTLWRLLISDLSTHNNFWKQLKSLFWNMLRYFISLLHNIAAVVIIVIL